MKLRDAGVFLLLGIAVLATPVAMILPLFCGAYLAGEANLGRGILVLAVAVTPVAVSVFSGCIIYRRTKNRNAALILAAITALVLDLTVTAYSVLTLVI
ncbi:hypothetical protein ACGFIV_33765 [Sphaerisporangium sp. NPDC049003]|uniref:hypothetical protein n=1 Tax=Sphaerisporangium sp. NPDC049003 TaxID=3364517 RepID=UPI003716795D